ncbi:MAG: hypothetical protein AB8C84_04665 [Oligoflexales bacterium]
MTQFIAITLSLFAIISCGETSFDSTSRAVSAQKSSEDAEKTDSPPSIQNEASPTLSALPNKDQNSGSDDGNGDGDHNDGYGNSHSNEQVSSSSSTERSFEVPETSKHDLSISAGYLQGDMVPTRPDITEEFSTQFKQIDRPAKMDLIQQGQTGQDTEENFQQSKLGLLDILLVVDNSGSMKDEQAKIAAKLPELLSHVKNTDWQISIVSTSISEPCNRALIKSTDSNAESVFSSKIQGLGIRGSGNEHGIASASRALLCPGFNWVRNGSNLAVLFVTDEDNCSTGSNGCSTRVNHRPQDLINLLNKPIGGSTRQVGVDAKTYGIFSIPGEPRCSQQSHPGQEYQQLITLTSGLAGSICENDYTNILKAISKDISDDLKDSIALQYTPDAGSLKVLVNGAEINDFSLNDKTITFATLPPRGATITAQYRYGSTPILKTFNLINNAVDGSGSVMITPPGGAGISVTDFSITGNQITFDTQPAEGSEIRVTYKNADIPLKKDFAIDKDLKEDNIKVLVDNSEANFRYNSTTGVITLDSAPDDLKDIKIDFEKTRKGDLITQFSVNAPFPDEVRVYKGTELYNDFTYDGKVLTLQNAEENIRYVLRYPQEDISTIQLDHIHIEGHPEVKVLNIENQATRCPISTLKLSGQALDISDCLPNEGNTVQISYRYREDFSIETNITNPERYQWMVLYEEYPITDFKREGSKITIPASKVPIAGKITIKTTIKQDF